MDRILMLPSVLVGLLVLPVSILIQATALAATVRFVTRLLRLGYATRSFWRGVSVAAAVMVILLAAILVQIAAWAVAFVICGAFPGFETAFYHSAVNFTTLGYGDIVMSPEWRLLGPLEAASGVLMLGLSASALFTVTHRLVEPQIHGHHDGPPSP
jgi:hypothetical protein